MKCERCGEDMQVRSIYTVYEDHKRKDRRTNDYFKYYEESTDRKVVYFCNNDKCNYNNIHVDIEPNRGYEFFDCDDMIRLGAPNSRGALSDQRPNKED